MDCSKLFYVFLGLCKQNQVWTLTKISKLVETFAVNFEALNKVLIVSKYSMPWVHCATSNFFRVKFLRLLGPKGGPNSTKKVFLLSKMGGWGDRAPPPSRKNPQNIIWKLSYQPLIQSVISVKTMIAIKIIIGWCRTCFNNWQVESL